MLYNEKEILDVNNYLDLGITNSSKSNQGIINIGSSKFGFNVSFQHISYNCSGLVIGGLEGHKYDLKKIKSMTKVVKRVLSIGGYSVAYLWVTLNESIDKNSYANVFNAGWKEIPGSLILNKRSGNNLLLLFLEG